MMCEGLCGGWHQEDPPMDDVALFGGAHVCKGTGIYMLLHSRHINEHASIYACIYIIHGNSQSF